MWIPYPAVVMTVFRCSRMRLAHSSLFDMSRSLPHGRQLRETGLVQRMLSSSPPPAAPNSPAIRSPPWLQTNITMLAAA